jgi:hypothetical protein
MMYFCSGRSKIQCTYFLGKLLIRIKNEDRKVFTFAKCDSLIIGRRPNISIFFYLFSCTVKNNFFLTNVLFQLVNVLRFHQIIDFDLDTI